MQVIIGRDLFDSDLTPITLVLTIEEKNTIDMTPFGVNSHLGVLTFRKKEKSGDVRMDQNSKALGKPKDYEFIEFTDDEKKILIELFEKIILGGSPDESKDRGSILR